MELINRKRKKLKSPASHITNKVLIMYYVWLWHHDEDDGRSGAIGRHREIKVREGTQRNSKSIQRENNEGQERGRKKRKREGEHDNEIHLVVVHLALSINYVVLHTTLQLHTFTPMHKYFHAHSRCLLEELLRLCFWSRLAETWNCSCMLQSILLCLYPSDSV